MRMHYMHKYLNLTLVNIEDLDQRLNFSKGLINKNVLVLRTNTQNIGSTCNVKMYVLP